jgi:hypothetical protein
VLHIPDDVWALHLPVLGQVHLPLTWVYSIAILLAIWLLLPLIRRHFASFLYLLFAMSIALPAYEFMKDLVAKYSR